MPKVTAGVDNISVFFVSRNVSVLQQKVLEAFGVSRRLLCHFEYWANGDCSFTLPSGISSSLSKLDLCDRAHFTVATTSTRPRMIQKMQMTATSPGLSAKSPLSQTGERAELVVFTVVAFGGRDVGGSVDFWETVSLDVWLMVEL